MTIRAVARLYRIAAVAATKPQVRRVSLLAEAIEPYDLAAALAVRAGRRRRPGSGQGIDLVRFGAWPLPRSGGIRIAGGFRLGGLELESELHRRIEERRDRIERDRQSLRDAAERQPDRERVVVDRKIPELILQDDRHLFRVLRPHALRQPD